MQIFLNLFPLWAKSPDLCLSWNIFNWFWIFFFFEDSIQAIEKTKMLNIRDKCLAVRDTVVVLVPLKNYSNAHAHLIYSLIIRDRFDKWFLFKVFQLRIYYTKLKEWASHIWMYRYLTVNANITQTKFNKFDQILWILFLLGTSLKENVKLIQLNSSKGAKSTFRLCFTWKFSLFFRQYICDDEVYIIFFNVIEKMWCVEK